MNLITQETRLASNTTRLIPLTQGQFAIVDAWRYEELSQYPWCSQWNPHTKSFYAIRQSPSVNGKQYTIRMHRKILGLKRGDSKYGDHKNHNTLDNTEKNLRIATSSQNQCNGRRKSNNTSGYKGVYRHSKNKNWVGRVTFGGKTYYCGVHETPKEASTAVEKLRKEWQ